MDRSRNFDKDIPDLEKSRFSAEERARMAEESEYSEVGHRQRLRKKAESARTKRDGSSGKRRGASDSPERSRNDRVKSSARQRKKNSKRQNNILVALLFAVMLAVIAVVCVFVLKINTVEIENPSELYSDTSVLKYAKTDVGDSMLLVNSKKAEAEIERNLPYIENAVIKRKWPDKLIITLEYAEPALAVDTGSGYIILNSSCKVLEKNSAVLKEPAAILRGVSLLSAVEGERAEFTGNINTDDLISLTTALEDSGFTDISCYDLSMLSDVIVMLDNRVEIKLGTLAGAADKFAFGKEVIARTAEKDTKHAMVVDLSTENEAYVRVKNDNSIDYNAEIPEETTAAEAVPEQTSAVSEVVG